ncbi:MAG: hypothetical protein ACLFPB_01800, partial [Desulfovermiculus sp.]
MNPKQPLHSAPCLGRFSVLGSVLGILVLCLQGCASSQQGWELEGLESNSTITQISPQETRPGTTSQKTSQPLSGQNEHNRDPGQDSQVSFVPDKEKLMALIPVPEQTTISPQYKDNTLELSFDPPVPSLQLPSSSPDQLIRDMKISSDSHGAHSLRLVFTQDVRFLVSRPKTHMAQVSLIPAKEAQADSKSDLKKPADPELKDIDFQAADNGDLLVQLTATSSFDYRLREGKKNALLLFFPDLHVPSKFIRLYNLSKFESTVSSALLTTTQDGAELTLADLDDPVPASWNGKTLTLRIPAAQSHG